MKAVEGSLFYRAALVDRGGGSVLTCGPVPPRAGQSAGSAVRGQRDLWATPRRVAAPGAPRPSFERLWPSLGRTCGRAPRWAAARWGGPCGPAEQGPLTRSSPAAAGWWSPGAGSSPWAVGGWCAPLTGSGAPELGLVTPVVLILIGALTLLAGPTLIPAFRASLIGGRGRRLAGVSEVGASR